MKKILLLTTLLFAFLGRWGGTLWAQTTTDFGSGDVKSTMTVDATTATFVINNPGDLANYTVDTNLLNGKDITVKSGTSDKLTQGDVTQVMKMTYNFAKNVYDLSQANLPADVKLSEVLVLYGNKMQALGYVLPLDYKELAAEFNVVSFVVYTDGTTAKLDSKGTNFGKAAQYLGSCKNLTILGQVSEDIDYSALSSLAMVDLSGATFANSTSTITLPENIEQVKVPQGFDKARILPETIQNLVEEVIPKENPYVKKGNALTVNLEEGMSLLDVLNEADMPYVSNLTIVTIGNRKLTSDDIAIINDLKFKYTKEADDNTTWQDATLNLEGCTIDNYDILKSLSNNASTADETTGIRNVILPVGLDKTIVKAEYFAGLKNMNAAISLSEDASALVGYVAKPGGLSTTMYQYAKFHPNIHEYSTSSLKSLTLCGTLLPCDFAGTLAGAANILDEEGHLSYEVDAAGSVTYTGVKSFATDADSKTTQALLGASLTDIDLENAVFTNYLDMNFSLLGHSNVVNVKLPKAASMTQIPPLCMDKCTKVEKLVVPGNFEELGAYAFNQMDGMHTLELGIGVKTLGSHCFQNCTGLKQVVLPIGMESVGEYAFVGCENIKDLNIPYGVKTIEAHAFENLDGLTAVRLPYTLETIGDYAFSDCNNISSITIPENVKEIGEGAFVLTNSLRDIYVLGTKVIPNIKDAYVDGAGNQHVGSFDATTQYKDGGTHDKTKCTQDDYWGNVSSSLPLGKGAAFLHFPTGYEEYYTDKARNDAFHAILVDKDGNPVLDEEGNQIKVPNGQDVAGAETWVANNKGWKRFMLTVANRTGDDNSSVWTVRHMYDDTWYTMCFPFDLTINQLISTFGAGFEIAYFCGVEKMANGNVVLQFTESNYMKKESTDYSEVGAKAGVPYMIHPNSGVGNYDKNGHKKTVFVFSGVSPDLKGNPAKGMKGYDYGEAGGPGADEKPDGYDTESYTFVGSYGTPCEEGQYFVDKHNEYVDEGENNVLKYEVGNATGTYKKDMPSDLLVPRAIPEGYYFLGLPANATYPKFYREKRAVSADMDNSAPNKTYTTGLWTRFTAMVKAVNPESQAAKNNLGITIGDFENKTIITGINIVSADGQQKEYIDLSNKVFNLNGQVVRSNTTDTTGLPKGVYIVKGKKIVVH